MNGDQSKTPSVCFADTSLKEGGKEVSAYSGNYSLRRVANINVGQRATVSRGGNRAASLPTHLLRICAGALKRHGLCAVSKFANGQRHTVALPRKHLLALTQGRL